MNKLERLPNHSQCPHTKDVSKHLSAPITKKSYCAPQLTIFNANEIVHGAANFDTDGFNTGS